MIKIRTFSTSLVLCFALAACNGADNDSKEKEVTEPAPAQEETGTIDTPSEETTIEDNDAAPDNWAEKIYEISSNGENAAGKFSELEQYLLEYEVSEEEVDQFKIDIVDDYKSGTYLNELDNHDRMLTNIFKSYFVEKNSEGALKEFAFDYFQNLKYAYRGVDTPDSEAVKSNEQQMNEMLPEI
ncbi:hypothetical protein [Ureibacillus sinduriensis]|nr:hypothetical protein [Ureibacillus sinduriensis]